MFGVTTVSVTGVDVIGEVEADCALNVDFNGQLPAAWFQPSLVELVGPPEGTVSIGGKDFTWAEDAADFVEVTRRPWWKFWR